MVKLAGIKACVFDAYGTLFDVHSAVGRLNTRLGEKADAVSQTWRDKQLQYTWLRSLMGAYVEFWQLTGEALDYALESHGISDETLKKDLMNAYLTLDAYPDVADCLTALKADGKHTAILSNGCSSMLQPVIDNSGLSDLLDKSISVEEVGIYKPDARVYQLACDAFGIEREEIAFVSNNPWDASGAAHFGFQVIRLNRFGILADKLPGKLQNTITNLNHFHTLV